MCKNHFIPLILIVISSFALGACKSEPVTKTRFGQTDAMQDGPLLAYIDGTVISTEEGEGETTTGSTPLKTAKSLEVDNLPANIEKMVGLCDAINMACVEMQEIYSPDDDDFMWHCVHLFASNCTDRKMGLERVGSYVEADQETVRDIMFAMFGKLREVPQIPETAITGDENGQVHISIGNNTKYRFSGGDRGMSAPEVRRVTQYSDASLEMEVALVDQETLEETVCFIYSLRANTKDTTTSARFSYEITGARSADKATSDKINGMPYLVPVIQTYGYDSYKEDDIRFKDVVEVLQFASFSTHVPGMEELNSRIHQEVLTHAMEEISENEYRRICSYPVSTDNLVQVAILDELITDNAVTSDIHCYNYDIKKSRILDENDALAIKNTTRDKQNERLTQLWNESSTNEGTVSGPARFCGFIIRDDGSADMYYFLDITDEEGITKKVMTAYNTSADRIRVIQPGDDLLPSSETDDFRPRLTHGRRAK